MTFWKTSFWAAIATVSRLTSQFVMAKLIALFAGPAAFGLIGQFQSFASMVQLGSGGITNTSVIKYSAEFKADKNQLQSFLQTVIKVVFFASFLTGIFISIFSMLISEFIFNDRHYYWVFILFGMTLFGYALNQTFLSLFNGLNEIKKYASMFIIGALLSIFVSGLFIYYYAVNGYFLGLVVSQCILFFMSILYFKQLGLRINFFSLCIDPKILKMIFRFSLMAVTSVICVPLAQMVIRLHIVAHSGWDVVGYWQAVLKISDAYLLIFTTIIGTYVLPKYAELSDKNLLKKEVFIVMKKILPFTVFSATTIYFFRDQVIILLFSSHFLEARSLFLFQLVGDVLKIASWVIANILIAKAQVKVFVIFEISFTLLFLLFSIVFFDFFGVVGLTMAFSINYFFYFLAVFFWFFRFLR